MTDLDPDSEHVLDLARAARTPDERDKARVAERLAGVLGAAAVAGTASTAHATAGAALTKSASSALLLKWLAGSALLAGAIAGYVVLSSRPPQAAAPAPRAPQPAAQGAALQPVAPAAPAAATPLAQPNAPAPQDGARERTSRRVEHRTKVDSSDALSGELELLHRAQTAWRARDAQGALVLLAEHRARFPHSQLELERDALQALALCQLGRNDEARRIALGVLARAPHSPLRASLEQSCALK